MAENEDEARTYIREYIRSSQVLGPGTEGSVPGFRWVPEPRSEGEII